MLGLGDDELGKRIEEERREIQERWRARLEAEENRGQDQLGVEREEQLKLMKTCPSPPCKFSLLYTRLSEWRGSEGERKKEVLLISSPLCEYRIPSQIPCFTLPTSRVIQCERDRRLKSLVVDNLQHPRQIRQWRAKRGERWLLRSLSPGIARAVTPDAFDVPSRVARPVRNGLSPKSESLLLFPRKSWFLQKGSAVCS